LANLAREKKVMRKLIPVLILGVSLAACAQGPGYDGGYGRAAPGEIGLNKTTGGTLVGAGLGGLAGSQFGHGSGKLAMTAIGVLAGGLAGSAVGSSLDKADLAYSRDTTQRSLETLPTNHSASWHNPDSGASGTVMPVRTYQAAGGQDCREFQQTITVGGRTEQGYGTACRQADGAWKIVQ
jgi:surface antigen